MPVSAESNTYELTELGLKILIPEQYYVITKDTAENDVAFKKFGIKKSDLINEPILKNIYLNAVTDDLSEEIVVTKLSNSLGEFSSMSDNLLEFSFSLFANEYTSHGIDVSSYDVYHHHQTNFIRIRFNSSDKTIYGIQYITSTDDKMMSLTMRSYSGPFSPRQEAKIKSIVDSVTFDKSPPKSKTGKDTESFLYTDSDTGLTFAVPANWEQKGFSKEREFLDVKFASTKANGLSISYGSVDAWEQLPSSEKAGYNRIEFNSSIFTKSDIAKEYGISEDKVDLVTYNNKEYYKVEITTSGELYGLDFSTTITQLFHIDNGWMYSFQFMGTDESEYYADFEKLLNSVQYPEVSTVSNVNPTNSYSSSSDPDSHLPLLVLIVSLLSVVAISAYSCIILHRRDCKKTTMAASKEYLPTQTHVSPEWLTCENCGQILPKDSKFCYKCGLKTTKENNIL